MATTMTKPRRGTRNAAKTRVGRRSPRADFWELRLYVAGASPKSVAALRNLESLCQEHLAGRYSIDIVDLLVQPKLAAEDQIVAIPTLVRRLPEPLRKIVGDLENAERTLVGLQLRPLPRKAHE